jgi:hypothetical protein
MRKNVDDCYCELFVNEKDQIEFAFQCPKHRGKPSKVEWK